jgi:RimJ/RimL family protein N-acetyltransferase
MSVRLRAPIHSDIAIFFEHHREPEGIQMAAFGSKEPYDRETFEARWARSRSDETIVMRVIEDDAIVVGYVASFLRDGVREVAYWLGRAHWGRGLASAALAEFLEDVETRRPLAARAASDNVASRRVLDKCGFVVFATERAFANARGEEIEEVVMRLDR